jgi:hypothetical protein
MSELDYDRYNRLCELVTVWPAFRGQWDTYQMVQLLHADKHLKEYDYVLPAGWFLEALVARHYAEERQFWHCAISSTIVRSASSTYVFETKEYSDYVEAVAIDG